MIDERKWLEQVNLSTIFLRFFTGFGAGVAGTIVLGIILLLTWGIVGDSLAPTANQTIEQVSTGIVLKQEAHPLFMSIVILAVFLGTLVANLCYALASSVTEEKYQNRTTNLTQAFLGNLVVLLVLIPVYLVSSSLYGSMGIGVTGMAHACLASMFCFLSMETIAQTRYFLLSLYSAILGMALFALAMNIVGNSNPTILTLTTLPFLLGCIGAGSAIAQMFYSWIQRTYGTDMLDSDKRFGDDYGVDQEYQSVTDDAEI